MPSEELVIHGAREHNLKDVTVRLPRYSLVCITGLSGSGKSSLLGAYLQPRLAVPQSGPKTKLITVRSYTDPLAAMKQALLPLWKKPPDDYETLSPLDALRTE